MKKETAEDFGYYFMRGVVRYLMRWVVWYMICIALSFVGVLYFCKLDSTDKSKWNRSGLNIYTDNATGVQYLGHGNALTVRLDKDGNPMREGE